MTPKELGNMEREEAFKQVSEWNNKARENMVL